MNRGTLGTILILALLGACQSDSEVARDLTAFKSGPPAATEPAPPRVRQVDWSSFGSCREQLGEFLRLARNGAALDPAALPFGVVVGPVVDRDRLSAPAVRIKADLPIPVGDPAARQAPCLLHVGMPGDLQAKRRIVGQETVASEYQTGLRREDNPAYQLAKVKVDRAKRQTNYDDEVWAGVGDPMIDLVGLLVGSIFEGFSEASRDSALDEAMLELASTPPKIDRPVYASYHFDRVIVDAARRATIPIELIDRRRGTRQQMTIQHAEQRRLHVPQGLSRRDRNYAEHEADGMSQNELKVWLRSPPEIRLSRLVEALLDEPPGTMRGPRPASPSDDGALLAGASAGAPAAGRRTMRSAGHELSGDFLEPELAPDLADWARLFGDDDGDLMRFDEPAERPPLSAQFERPFRATGRSRLAVRPAADGIAAASPELATDDGWRDPFAPSRSRPRDRQTADLSGDARFASVVVIRSGSSLGSGFYIRPNLVVTNHHVVGGADLVDLASVDGSRVMGMVIANDVGRDLALIHTPRPGPPAPLYRGPELRPGSTVDAIGAPHGYDFTLTRGIVSAVRSRPALLVPSMQRVRYIQTDADINHGNSGGPLFLGEQVVGVNDRVDPEAVSGGLNFAIHVDELRAFLGEEGIELAGGADVPPSTRPQQRAGPGNG